MEEETIENICLSGGAEGADLQWGMCAGKAGHMVIHWSFGKHNTGAPSSEVVILTDEQLREADEHCLLASKSIHRPFTQLKPYVKRLIQRNWFQVRDSSRVYAVGILSESGQVSGGTAWAIQMFIDNNTNPEIYFFNQANCGRSYEGDFGWNQYVNGMWQPISKPPKPEGIWTGIGTRDLSKAGKTAIRNLLEYTEIS